MKDSEISEEQTVAQALPPLRLTDQPDAPRCEEYTVLARDGDEATFVGYKLSHASSRSDDHTHRGEFAPPGWKCPGCRWFEVTIYRLATDGEPSSDVGTPRPVEARYVVHTVGRSDVPTETNFARVAYADTPHKVIELLAMQREGHAPRLPRASAAAVDAASVWDAALDQAYDSWVTAGVR